MALARRKFLRLAAGAAALTAVPRFASAQIYPTRPVRWIVAVAPGGGNDIFARLMGHEPTVIEVMPINTGHSCRDAIRQE